MLEAYTLNATVPINSAIPFNNVTMKKGCTAVLNGVSTIELNKCGVYMISFDGSAAADVTLQAFLDGVALPQAQSTGTNPSFVCLVTATDSSSCCSMPTTVQVKNIGEAEATLTDANIVVTKIC